MDMKNRNKGYFWRVMSTHQKGKERVAARNAQLINMGLATDPDTSIKGVVCREPESCHRLW
eukprot:7049843-Prorocentrum_lima.AAC.1